LPHERQVRHPTPLADHVETVAGLVAREYVLPILIIDAAGPRVSEIVLAEIRDLDEHRHAIRLRDETTEQHQAGSVELPDALRSALRAPPPAREDRDLDAPIFPGLTDANLRMAITRRARRAACRTSRRMGYDVAAGRSPTSAPARSPRWRCCSATPNASPPSTTCMRSPTTGRSTGSPRSGGCSREAGR